MRVTPHCPPAPSCQKIDLMVFFLSHSGKKWCGQYRLYTEQMIEEAE
jgi:hypothetical protein